MRLHDLHKYLQSAHRSANPIETLQDALPPDITKEDVNNLIANLRGSGEFEDKDVENYVKTRDTLNSSAAFKSFFIHFATSLCFVFVNQKCQILNDYPIITYRAPTRTIPFIWLDFNDLGVPKVMKHWDMYDKELNISVYTVPSVRENPKQTNYKIDLTSGVIMEAKRKGLFSDISVYNQNVKLVHSNYECAWVLTYNVKFCGIYLECKMPIKTALIVP